MLNRELRWVFPVLPGDGQASDPCRMKPLGELHPKEQTPVG